jgi:hypothetical protein
MITTEGGAGLWTGSGRRAHTDRVPGFVVTAVFVLESGPATGWKVPLGSDVLGVALGPGHRFSYSDGRTLTVVYELVAVREAAAFEAALSRIENAWQKVGGKELPAPSTLRLQRAVPFETVAAGLPGRSSDSRRKAAARAIRRLRYFDQAIDPLQRLRIWADLPWGDDGPDDDGGLAGVHEPRRPSPGPGQLHAERPLPGPMPQPPTLQGPASPGPSLPDLLP